LAFCLALPLSSLLAQINKPVNVTPPEPLVVKAGATVDETLNLSVREGFHVNSDKPKDDYIIPIKLSWAGGPVETRQVIYPKPEEMKVGDQQLTVFSGAFSIKTQFHVAEGAAKGTFTVNGKLHYQACNNEMCLRPVTVDIPLTVSIE
jgi:DsbC/DsbD-like thiol-disulfide interchange protein